MKSKSKVMKLENKSIVVFLLSLSLISMEIIWTRIFSAEYFYTFAFLILSISILGLGLGALTLRMSRRLSCLENFSWLLSLTAFFMIIGPPVVLHMQLDFTHLFSSGWMVVKLVSTILILGSSFFTGGIVLAGIFRQKHENMHRLYMADLVGAALGVAVSVLLMNSIGTNNAAFFIGVPILMSAAFSLKSWHRLAPLGLLVVSFSAMPFSATLLSRPIEDRAEVIYSHWDAMSKLKVYKFSDDYWGLNIDNAANSPVYKFDGNWDRPDSLKFQFTLPVDKLIGRFKNCSFLSLGAGGGGDVLQALQEGAAEIHAVEVNPHINRMMKKGFLKEFSGDIYNDPRVKVVSEDARSYVRKFRNHFDIIYSLSSNTFAALASGSFALAENYLFTTEAFSDYYKALSPDGFLMMEHQFYVPRMVSEVIEGLKKEGIQEPEKHLAVYHLPTMRRHVIIMGKKPLDEQVIYEGIHPVTAENYSFFRLMYPAADSIKDNLINQVILHGWESQQANTMTDLSPSDDDRPFTAQLGMMKNFSLDNINGKLLPYEFQGFPLAIVIVLVVLVIIVVLILPLNLLPYALKGNKLNFNGWMYFFMIGIGFMALEIILIQKYTWFIGSSSYTFMTILFSLLASSGMGSLYSGKFKNYTPFVFIALWILADIFIVPHILKLLTPYSTSVRIIVTVLFIAPLGFFMGMPFVKGSRKVGELIDWGFAINGAASVIGSTLVLLPVFNYGFSAGLTMSLGAYAFALYFLQRPMVALK
ncbi:hypothetical protein DMA11_05830 [Marinilabiliaceae bacterium JC017]|nr:hypothetical protein DMA11_05830 [Marinilabiliaceae bacterium JC017]